MKIAEWQQKYIDRLQQIYSDYPEEVTSDQLRILLEYTKYNSIPKDKIREKISKLDEDIKEYKIWQLNQIETDVEYYDNIGNEVARDILKELLEEE